MKNPFDGLNDGVKFLIALVLAILIVIGLVLLFSATAHGQEVTSTADQINTLDTRAGDLTTQIHDMTYSVYPKLKARKEDLNAERISLVTDADAFSQTADNLGIEIDAVNEALAKHNNEKVDRHSLAAVNAFNAESDRLTGVQNSLKKKQVGLENTRDSLQSRVTRLTDEEAQWYADLTTTQGKFSSLLDEANKTLEAMSAAAKVYGVCMDKNPNDDDAGLRRDCGDLHMSDIRVNVHHMMDYKNTN